MVCQGVLGFSHLPQKTAAENHSVKMSRKRLNARGSYRCDGPVKITGQNKKVANVPTNTRDKVPKKNVATGIGTTPNYGKVKLCAGGHWERLIVSALHRRGTSCGLIANRWRQVKRTVAAL